MYITFPQNNVIGQMTLILTVTHLQLQLNYTQTMHIK